MEHSSIPARENRSVMTVLGPVAPDDLGRTLTHEHCLIDLRSYWARPKDVARRALAEAPVGITTIGVNRRNPLLCIDNLLLDDVGAAVDEGDAFLFLQRVAHVADGVQAALFLRRVLAAGARGRIDEGADGSPLVRPLQVRRCEHRQKHRYDHELPTFPRIPRGGRL